MIKIGCSGFPVATKKYQAQFPVVEATPFQERYPRLSTVQKWKAEAPQGFEYVVCAPPFSVSEKKLFSPSHLKKKRKLSLAFRPLFSQQLYHQLLTFVHTLSAKIISFKLPSSFPATPDNIGKIQSVFTRAPREKCLLVWDPPSSWSATLVRDISTTLDLVPAVNPLVSQPHARAPIRYYRLGNPQHTSGIHTFSDGDLKAIAARCVGVPTYVIFNNGPASYADAARLDSLVHPV